MSSMKSGGGSRVAFFFFFPVTRNGIRDRGEEGLVQPIRKPSNTKRREIYAPAPPASVTSLLSLVFMTF